MAWLLHSASTSSSCCCSTLAGGQCFELHAATLVPLLHQHHPHAAPCCAALPPTLAASLSSFSWSLASRARRFCGEGRAGQERGECWVL
jgi:hypothetical protein